MKPKKLKFRKAKRKPARFSPAVGEALIGAIRNAFLVLSEWNQGWVNISPLLSDAAKEAAYEAGFPGFNVHIPYPKPIRPAFPRGGYMAEDGPEYIIRHKPESAERFALRQQMMKSTSERITSNILHGHEQKNGLASRRKSASS